MTMRMPRRRPVTSRSWTTSSEQRVGPGLHRDRRSCARGLLAPAPSMPAETFPAAEPPGPGPVHDQPLLVGPDVQPAPADVSALARQHASALVQRRLVRATAPVIDRHPVGTDQVSRPSLARRVCSQGEERSPAGAQRASPVRCDEVRQRSVVGDRIGIQRLQPRALLLRRPQLVEVEDGQAAGLRLRRRTRRCRSRACGGHRPSQLFIPVRGGSQGPAPRSTSLASASCPLAEGS